MPNPTNSNNTYREMDDLIGDPPSWLLRSGITIMAIVFGSIIFLADFIKYPDKVSALGFLDLEKERFAMVYLPAKGVAKPALNTKTSLKLLAFPSEHYGLVNASITAISLLPNGDKTGVPTYELKILIPDTLTTNNGIVLPTDIKSSLSADFFTEDRSVLARIFQQLLEW